MELLLKQKIEKLVDGKATFSSGNLGFNLLISRLQKKYADSHVPATLSDCLTEIDTFLVKYSSIMTNDIELIKKI